VINSTFARLAVATERWHLQPLRGSRDAGPPAEGLGDDSSAQSAGAGCVDGLGMKLSVLERSESEELLVATDPQPDLIASVVLGLEWSDITFVTLTVGEGDWMCVTGSFPDGFAALYCEGGKNHISDRPPESLQDMIALLQSYRRQDGRWREMTVWQ
jgi:hypothetical protein